MPNSILTDVRNCRIAGGIAETTEVIMWRNNSMDVKNKIKESYLFLFLYKNHRRNCLAQSHAFKMKNH
jgi:hypothetical protein